jgi:MYXO-CTERM domain-containing protein
LRFSYVVGTAARTRRAARLFAFGVAALTLALPAQAYRTAGELPEFAGTEKVRWASDSVEYVLNTEMPGGMTLDEAAATVHRALSSWMDPTCSVLSFRSAGATDTRAQRGDGLNTIQWIHGGWADLGFPADAAALSDVQYEQVDGGQWVIAEADLYLNGESYDWVPEPAASDQQNLLSVVTHEAGHILGLLHPCEPGGAEGAPECSSDPAFAETTMYPFYSDEQATLADDDVAGLCSLYPGSRCETTGCPADQKCTPEGCRAECAGVVCGANERCVESVCTPPEPPCEREDCNVPENCASDDDCPLPYACVEQRCARGDGATGDHCASDRDCAAGVCSASGACLAQCSFDQDCPAGQSCTINDGRSACGSDGKAIGERCDSADDCAGALCVAELSDSPMCTRACGGANAACPGGWTCDRVGGQAACVPVQATDEGCGCSVVGERSRQLPAGALLVLGLGLILARRRPRRPV